MRVCFFGSYDPRYSRNKILIDGLEKNNVLVLHCRSTHPSVFTRYPELIKQFLKIGMNYDILYVGFVGHLDMPLAFVLAKLTGKKVVFDMFYSMYDTYVYDRQSAKSESWRAKSYYWIDRIAAVLADLIITDTRAHTQYFIKNFHINRRKFQRIFVGGDDTLFKPFVRSKRLPIVIEFHGMFTRLHGAEYFVKAAKLLENNKSLCFLLIGSTSNYPLPIEIYKKLRPKTMKYIPALSLTKLAKTIAESDICIGHVGITQKAKRVITNKMYHGIFCKVAVIAGNCQASRELFTNRKTALFVKMGDVVDLAEKIKLLAFNSKLRNDISENGYKLAKSNLTNYQLGKKLLGYMNHLIRS